MRGRTVLCMLALVTALVAYTTRSNAQERNPYTLRVGNVAGILGSEAAVPFLLDNTGSSSVLAWSFGACHQGPVDVVAVVDGAATAVANGGEPPDFVVSEIYAGEGFTVGVIVDIRGANSLDPGTDLELHVAQYALLGGGNALLHFCNTLGDPPIVTVLVIEGEESVVPDTVSGTVSVTLPSAVAFSRGDCNDDGAHDIADCIFLLAHLYQDGAAGACEAACNADGVGEVDVMDAVHFLYYLFLGGEDPPAPFPECGVDEEATCAATAMCP